MRNIRLYAGLIVCLVLSAPLLHCGELAAGQKKDILKFNKMYERGEYAEAADFELDRIGDDRSDKAKLLQSLQAAAALRYDSRLELSSRLFDESDAILREHEEKLLASTASSSAGAVLLNDSSLDYKGTVYDGVMLNTYNALNFWEAGKTDLARIEFNRALERQRRAVERFASEIEKTRRALAEKQASGSVPLDVERRADSPEVDALIQQNYSNIFAFEAYPDFANPFANYAAGLFFLSQKDYPRAEEQLKRVVGMSGMDSPAKGDLALVVEALRGNEDVGAYTWVIFENGSGPVREEIRLDLPLFIVSRTVKYTGIALPTLAFREKGCEYLNLKTGDETVGRTAVLSSMDRVVQTEFKKRYPAVLRRAIASAAVKTVAQAQVQKQLGDIGGLLGGLAQRATTIADTRMWTALPKEFQIARIKTPEDGRLEIVSSEGRSFAVTVPPGARSIVYIKIPSMEARPYCSVTAMDALPAREAAVSVSSGKALSTTEQSLP
ncbi:MAG TPA: hypothetical protein DEQ23_07710 [Chlorobium sp.]|uniref:Tetratricopeptide repeat protein n=1 Tax=Chlorobium phaeovibrioides (strain DSM 265 / 1930) TaxID=290318 RepID=A4SCH0_CHLPM|nr:hypothetical protein [Chlorobium sp.]